MRRSSLLYVVAFLTVTLVSSDPSSAVTPGANGKIAFSSDRDGDNEIFTIKPNGTGLTQITHNTFDDITPAWAPDGRIAWASDQRAAGQYDIFVARGDGSGARNVTAGALISLRYPTWSPDGTKIAFMGRASGRAPDIYAMNSDGSGIHLVAALGAADVEDCCPDWSPDGATLVFESEAAGKFDIYTVRADGSAPAMQLTSNSIYDGTPAWTSDGLHILFRERFGVYRMNRDGSGIVRVSLVDCRDATACLDRTPESSPDGTKIVFSSNRDGNDEIYVMNQSGSGSVRLTNDPGSDRDPAWRRVLVS